MSRLMGLIALFTILFSMTACAAGAAPSGIEAGRDTEQTSAVSETAPSNETYASDQVRERHTDTGRAADSRNTETGNNEMGKFDFNSRTVLLTSGYTMPIIGLGTYALDHDTCVNPVKRALHPCIQNFW